MVQGYLTKSWNRVARLNHSTGLPDQTMVQGYQIKLWSMVKGCQIKQYYSDVRTDNTFVLDVLTHNYAINYLKI